MRSFTRIRFPIKKFADWCLASFTSPDWLLGDCLNRFN